MFHICWTIQLHFSIHQVKLCIGQRKYKQKFTTQGRKDRPTDQPTDQLTHRQSEWICACSLNSYFAFCKIVVKTMWNQTFLKKQQWRRKQTNTLGFELFNLRCSSSKAGLWVSFSFPLHFIFISCASKVWMALKRWSLLLSLISKISLSEQKSKV